MSDRFAGLHCVWLMDSGGDSLRESFLVWMIRSRRTLDEKVNAPEVPFLSVSAGVFLHRSRMHPFLQAYYAPPVDT